MEIFEQLDIFMWYLGVSEKGSVPQVYRNFLSGNMMINQLVGGILFLTTHLLTLLGILHLVFVWVYKRGPFGDIVGGKHHFFFLSVKNFVSPTGRCPSDPYFLLGSMGESTGSLWVKSERWAFLFITVGSICYIYTYKYIYIFTYSIC